MCNSRNFYIAVHLCLHQPSQNAQYFQCPKRVLSDLLPTFSRSDHYLTSIGIDWFGLFLNSAYVESQSMLTFVAGFFRST